jgi:hypothetical protein
MEEEYMVDHDAKIRNDSGEGKNIVQMMMI